MDKREKILRSYDHYKRQILHWERAVVKTTNRKPDASDLSIAPVAIQKAYKEYKRIKKYLESRSSIEEENDQPKATAKKLKLTPQKIFFRTKLDLSVRNAIKNRSPGVNRNGLYKKLSSKLFTVSSSSGKEWDATVLRKTNNESNNTTNNKEGTDCVDSENQTHTLISKQSEMTAGVKTLSECQSEDNCADEKCVIKENHVVEPNKNINRISALWHNPRPVSNSLLNPPADDGRKVDKSWLERCGIDLNHSIEDPDFDTIDSEMDYIHDANKTTPNLRTNGFVQDANTGTGCSDDFILNIDDIRDVLTKETVTTIINDPEDKINSSKTELMTSDVVEEQPTVSHVNIRSEIVFKEVDTTLSARKRKSTVAFSPSPEKRQPKRKFFKSSLAERNKNRFVPKSTLSMSTRSSAKSPQEPTSTSTIVNNTSGDLSATIPVAVVAQNISEHENSFTESETPSEEVTVPPKANKRLKNGYKTSVIENKNENVARMVSSKDKRSTRSTNYDGFDEPVQPQTGSFKKIRAAKLTGKQLLERKIKNGNLNDNFIRIDLEKKVYVRGRKKVSGAKVKRLNWKMKKSAALKDLKTSTLTCRKCGETGHFAKFCIAGLSTTTKEEPDEIDDSPFPSLEEAARMAFSKKASNNIATKSGGSQYNLSSQERESTVEPHSDANPESTDMDVSDNEIELMNNDSSPYFDDNTDINEQDKIIEKTLKLFGYTTFRSGQKEAILRVLKGLSTLVILSTGSGKSLCYQLPAYLYAKKNPGDLTLCISPLVSLMEDQVQGVPSFLQAACLHNNMSTKQKEVVLEKLRKKTLQILLVSPEAICGGLFGLMKTGNLPKIAFACIDEVHCVSQWSHNFRPSYLQLCKILIQKLNVKIILGLTATATDQTTTSICEHLQIDPSTSVKGEIIPSNLNLSASRDQDREIALLNLLRGDRFKDCDSVIIYCTRRDNCEVLAKFIRTKLQEGSFNGIIKGRARQKISSNCEAYHAGMTAAKRRTVQRLFMNGEIRIVVATVAFGMGIDKSDIRAVIHYNMPKTFESYVQEIGRAGRDGLPAQCHLFLDNAKGKDLCELKRHVYSNSVDRTTLRKLLRRMFKPCKCRRIAEIAGESQNTKKDATKRCPGHEVSFSVNDTITEVDLPQENIMTILCYMELDSQRKWIEVLPLTYEMCKIHSYGGPKLFKTSALKCPPLAVAIALQKEKKKFKDTDAYIEFNVIEAAATVGWSSIIVKRELKNLEWAGTEFDNKGNPTKFRKSGMLVEFSELAFRIEAPGDLTDDDSDKLLDYLHKMNVDQEKTQMNQLHRVYQALFSISGANVGDSCDDFNVEKSDRLKEFIHDYFRKSKSDLLSPVVDVMPVTDKEEEIRRDARNLIFSSPDTIFTGRAIAKIFQGIPSPCFPAEQWGRNRAFWRRFLDVDFHLLCQIAGQEVLKSH